MVTSWSSIPDKELKNQVEEIVDDKLFKFTIVCMFILLGLFVLWGVYTVGYNNGLLFNGG
jgi:hypothetical protein